MKKRSFKKILLGSLLTSVATAATASFAINASNENSSNQNNNTSSYKSIYIQQTGLQKPTFTKTVTQPTTTTSTDGEVIYTLTNFDPNTMNISLAQGSNGTLGTYNPVTKTIEVLELSNGQHAQIQVIPKSGKTWTDGTNTAQKSSKFTPAQTYVGIATKPTFTKMIKQSTITSPNGEVTYTLTNFDPNTMNISLAQGSNGTLGTYDPATNMVKVTGLKVGQHAQIMVSTKSDTTIEGIGAYDATPSGKMFAKDSENYNNRFPVNPLIKLESSKFTANKNSLISFDFTMKSLATNKNNPTYKEVMAQGQYSKHISDYFVFDKKLQKWTYNGKNVEGKANAQAFYLTTYDENNETYHPRVRIWVESYDPTTSKMSIKYDISNFWNETVQGGAFSNGNNNFAISDIKILSSQTSMPYEPNGGLLNQKSSIFTPTKTYVGLAKTTFTNTIKQPTTTTTTDGEVTFTLINFDKDKMDISLHPGSNGTLGVFDPKTNTIKVTHLANGQYTQIQTTLKTNEVWKDGTRTAQTSSKVNLSQSYAGLTKTTFTNTVTQPKTTTSTDGEVTFTLTNFDPVNMVLSTASGSSGILGSFDTQTNTIKVTHLANGQHAQIQITLKPYISWSDGTSDVVNSPSINLVQTVTGIAKTTFTNTVIQPKTTASTDGEANFKITNFDTTKMDVSLVVGSSGTIGTYDPQTKTIKVTGLVHKQHAQIQVTLKTNNIWADGTTSIIKSPIVNISQTNTGLIKTTFTNTVTQPKTTTSTDGEVTFTMIYYNPARMDVSLAPGSGGKLGTFDSNNNKIKVTGLASGQHAQIQVTLKQNQIWTDGTSVVVISSSINLIQTDVGLAKTTFTNTVTQPKTTTSTDGEATFTLTNFDGTKMDISLATGSSGDLGTFDPQTNTIQVTHLSNGQHTQIQVTLKVQHIWVDGTSSVLNSPLIRMNQSSAGLTKTTFTNTVTQPKTTTSTDGEATFTLTNFDKDKMNISLATGSSGTLGTYDPQTKQIKVTGVAVGQHAQIQVAPKANNLWVDGTTTPQKSSTFKPVQTFVGLIKTTFTHTVTQPKTTASTDGEVAFTLTNFNPITMNLSITFGSNGRLGSFEPATRTIKVTHLSNGQHAQIQVTLKSTSDIWDDGKILPVKSTSVTISQQQLGITIPTTKHQSIQPKTTTSTNGEVTFTLTNFNPIKMDISLAPGSSGILGTFDPQTNTIKVTNLMHGQHAQIQFTLKPTLIWSDGTTTPAKSFKIRIQHNSSWLKKVEISSVVSTPTTKKSKDGAVIFKLKNFHPSKMSVDFAENSDGSIGEYDPENDTLEIIGLASGEYVQVEVSLKGDQAWLDGTDEPIQSKKIKIIDNGIKNVKIVKTEFTQPTSTTTGTITLTLGKYDSNNVIAALRPGSHGSIGAYNAQTKQIQITGLQKNEKAEIEFSLKPNNNATGLKNWWENGTDEPQQKVLYMGYNKISLDNVELLVPTKASSNDGQITFNIPGFNPATMEVKLLKGSSGVLGKFDPKNNKIKVSELKIGESAQIKIFLKDKTLIWSDGSSQQIESTKIKIPASYATDPSSSSSNQGGISKLLLVGIVIGAVIVINVGWIGMYKILKSKRNLF